MPNRIKELRDARGWSLRFLADEVNSTTSTIRRLENGEVELVHPLVPRIADKLGVPWPDIAGIPYETSGAKPPSPALNTAPGFAESAVPFTPPPAHELSRLTLGPTEALFQARTDDLDNLNIYSGDVLIVDIGAVAVAAAADLDIVVAQIYDATELTKAVTIIRQFIEPSLLITNSSGPNAVPLNMRKADAHIKGVVRARHGPPRPSRR